MQRPQWSLTKRMAMLSGGAAGRAPRPTPVYDSDLELLWKIPYSNQST